MAVIRLNEFPKLEAAILKAVYNLVKNEPKDGRWREFKGTVRVKGRPYHMECTFRLNGEYFSIKQSKVESDSNIIIPYVNRNRTPLA